MAAVDPQEDFIITPEQAAEVFYQRRRMRQNLSPFIKEVFVTVDPGAVYKHNWHIDLICEYLEALYYREIQNLVINIGPRFLKSICCTIGFPAWVHGQEATERIISASGVAALAIKHSADTRKVMQSRWYHQTFPSTHLNEYQYAKSRYETTEGGHRIALSVGGSSVGEGGRIKIIDDPIDPTKAIKGGLSTTEIDAVNSWYDNTWSTRSDDPKRTVELLVMQRIHTKDLTQHLLDKGDWELLSIPQRAEKKTIVVFPRTGYKLTREKDALIHPERFDETADKKSKSNLGTYGYASQQQQRPTARGGNRIKLDWFPRFRTLPLQFDEIIQSWDTGNKPDKLNNPSACLTFGRSDKRWFLFHIFKDQLAYPALKRTVKSLADSKKPDTILIEDKASGTQILQEVEGLPLIGVDPTGQGDKVMRMETQTSSLESGLVALPDNTDIDVSWLFDFEKELQSFPMCSEWDCIDSLSQFLKWVRKRDDSGLGDFSLFTAESRSYWKGK